MGVVHKLPVLCHTDTRPRRPAGHVAASWRIPPRCAVLFDCHRSRVGPAARQCVPGGRSARPFHATVKSTGPRAAAGPSIGASAPKWSVTVPTTGRAAVSSLGSRLRLGTDGGHDRLLVSRLSALFVSTVFGPACLFCLACFVWWHFV